MAKSFTSLPALGYLAHPEKHPARPVCVLFGEEAFLKQHVLALLRKQVLTGDDGEFSYRSFLGVEIEDPRAVFDELGTVALFGGGQRLVVVNEADSFVTKNRATLEGYVAKPTATGVLVLEVKSWPSTTKLYKAVAEKGLPIDCGTPSPGETMKWMRNRAQQEHRATFASGAAERLIEIIGPQLGRLDQEIAKLALLGGAESAFNIPHSPVPIPDSRTSATITLDLVNNNVGGWQVREIWGMIGAAAAGDATRALVMLDRLVAAGEQPVGLLAMLASKLRPLAAATRAFEDAEAAGRRITPRQAVAESAAKVWPQMLDEAERNMKQLGRERTGQIYRWLLEADLAIKGSKSKGNGPRMVLEELIVRLGRPADSNNRN
jgi:DNA polymerase-3 subunit delta